MKAGEIVRAGLCVGCGGCAPRMSMDRDGFFKPDGAGDVEAICPFSPRAADEDVLAAELYPEAPRADGRLGRFAAAYVGYVEEGSYRERGSSGGLATWVCAELLRRGRVDGVAHVAEGEGGRFFRYRISRTEAEIRAGARSRYYPVEMSGVLAEMRAAPGRYALVGVPCFIKAARLLARKEPLLRERIACALGLFCGHMKSARMIESFAWQMGARVEDVARVEFRGKSPDKPAKLYTAELTLLDGRVLRKTWWDMADGDWGAGFFQNPACDACDDVVAETADISFGDAWVEPYASQARGVNVVIARSPEMAELLDRGIRDGRLRLEAADAELVARTQAAGLRQRREGLAYRLSLRGPRTRKRVGPRADGLPPRRRLVYRARRGISRWSHRVFRAARALRWPSLYLLWARAALRLYQGLAYSRGRIGTLFDRLLG